MVKRVSAWEARRNFGKLMDEVARDRQPIIVESHGNAKVALVDPSVVEEMDHNRKALQAIVENMRANVTLDDDALDDLIESEVAASRAERRSKARVA